MKFRKKPRNRTSSILYFVPLVNVVFLLIFFFVVMHVLSLEPEAMLQKTSHIQVPEESVSLAILPGKIMLDGKPSQKQSLAAIPLGKKIVISVSPEIPYLNLAEILDVLRSSGHTNLYFTTSPIHN
jgi:biopolymer transport protein ExbD